MCKYEHQSIKDTQSAILDILKEYDSVCRKNDIKYSLHGGTLLGAVRDKGFILWDDDADVTMMRDEYERLENCFNNSSENYILINSYLHMPRIIKKVLKEEDMFSWLDIMIYDPVSEIKFIRNIKFILELLFQASCRNKTTIKLAEGKNHSDIQMMIFRLAYILGQPFSYEKKYALYNRFCSNCFNGKGTLIHRSNDQMKGMKMKVPAFCMNNYIDVPFEDTLLMVTANYHEILTISYGDTYMTPIKDPINEYMHSSFRKAFLEHLNIID